MLNAPDKALGKIETNVSGKSDDKVAVNDLGKAAGKNCK